MRLRLRRGGIVAAAALAVMLPAAPAAGQSEDFALSRPADHIWRWAFVEHETAARAAPDGDAPVVARVSTRTPEKTPEILPLLERRSSGGEVWVRVRLPVLPNGTTGWVRRDRLSGYEVVRTQLIVDRGRLTARLERRGRTVFRARVGIGRRKWPTPRGRFIVRNRLSGFDNPIYGALAFGTTARSATLTDWPGGGFIGIHGTDEPEILPGRVSHGCIRLADRKIRRLDRLMPFGTPVTVR